MTQFLGNLPAFVNNQPRTSTATQRLAAILQRLSAQESNQVSREQIKSNESLTREKIQAQLSEIASREGIAAAELAAREMETALKASQEAERLGLLERGQELGVIESFARNPNVLPEDALNLFKSAGISVPEGIFKTSPNPETSPNIGLPSTIEEYDSAIKGLTAQFDSAPAGKVDRLNAQIRALQSQRDDVFRRQQIIKSDEQRTEDILRREAEREEDISIRGTKELIDQINIDLQRYDPNDIEQGFSLIDLRNQVEDSPLFNSALRRRFDREIVPALKTRVSTITPTDLFKDSKSYEDKLNSARGFLEKSKAAGVPIKELAGKKNQIVERLVTDFRPEGRGQSVFTIDEIPKVINRLRGLSSVTLTDDDTIPIPVYEYQHPKISATGVETPEGIKFKQFKQGDIKDLERVIAELEKRKL